MSYVVAFVLSLIILDYASKLFCSNRKIAGWFFVLIGIVIPSVLAGCRDISVGTDTGFYVQEYFKIARYSDSYRQYLMYINTEPGYAFLNYIVAKCTSNLAWFLFAVQFFNLLLICVSVINIKRYTWLPIALFVYYFLFYNMSLNMTRQMMAEAVCLYSFSFMIKGRYGKSVTVALLALMFHNTAFVYMLIYPIYYLTQKSIKHFTLLEFAGTFIAILSVLLFDVLLSYFIQFGVLDAHFDIYSSANGMWGSNIPLSDLYVVALLFVFVCLLKSNVKMKVGEYNFYHFLYLLCIILCFTAVKSTYAVRGMYYFVFISIIIVPRFRSCILKRRNKFIFDLLFAIVITTYWILTVTVANLGDTYPYASDILGL